MKLNVSIEEFRKMAEEKVEEIRKYKRDVLDELRRLIKEGKYQDYVCRGESGIFQCAVEQNKIYFDTLNRLGDFDGSWYGKITRDSYRRHLGEIGSPVVNVSIPSEDGEYYIKFAVKCPAYSSDRCLLKNFSYKKKKEGI